MHRFDYSFLDDGMLPASLVGLTAEIYSLRSLSALRQADHPAVFNELEAIAKVQSVKASNALEGIVTSDERIAEIVNRSTAPRGHDEQEIAGYRDALALVHENHESLDLRETDLLQLHHLMLAHAGEADAGSYKTSDNLIMEITADGSRRVRFEPVPAADTPKAMGQLVLAYLDARANPRINQLLLVPCVVLDFLCIHPFRDGNGRMSRLVTLLLLYKAGFDAGRYISFEEQVNEAKTAYYRALEESSLRWHDNASDYAPFMRNFLTTLYRCYSEIDKRFAVSNSKRVTKTSRVEATVLNSLTPLSKAEVCKALPDVSPTTVEAVLGAMVKDGRIRIVGAGRSSRYLPVR